MLMDIRSLISLHLRDSIYCRILNIFYQLPSFCLIQLTGSQLASIIPPAPRTGMVELIFAQLNQEDLWGWVHLWLESILFYKRGSTSILDNNKLDDREALLTIHEKSIVSSVFNNIPRMGEDFSTNAKRVSPFRTSNFSVSMLNWRLAGENGRTKSRIPSWFIRCLRSNQNKSTDFLYIQMSPSFCFK